MTKLTLKDFKLDKEAKYYYYKNDKYEVRFQPCLKGFDVGLYGLNKDLIKKTCTENETVLMDFMRGRETDEDLPIDQALKIANTYLHR